MSHTTYLLCTFRNDLTYLSYFLRKYLINGDVAIYVTSVYQVYLCKLSTQYHTRCSP